MESGSKFLILIGYDVASYAHTSSIVLMMQHLNITLYPMHYFNPWSEMCSGKRVQSKYPY